MQECQQVDIKLLFVTKSVFLPYYELLVVMHHHASPPIVHNKVKIQTLLQTIVLCLLSEWWIVDIRLLFAAESVFSPYYELFVVIHQHFADLIREKNVVHIDIYVRVH